MVGTKYYLDCMAAVQTSADGPHPSTLFESDRIKQVAARLKAGQSIPPHQESLGIYHFLEGEGVMFVDEAPFNVRRGTTIIVPEGAERGISALTDVSFLGTRINPCRSGSEGD